MTRLLVLALEVEAEALRASRELGVALVKVPAGCLLLLAPAGSKVDPGAGCLQLGLTPGTRLSCTTRTLPTMMLTPEWVEEAFL